MSKNNMEPVKATEQPRSHDDKAKEAQACYDGLKQALDDLADGLGVKR